MNNDNSNNTVGIFEFHDNGFTIELQQKKRTVAWNEIESINAYKVDLMTFDEICLDIVLEKTCITITEETDGWDEFIEKLYQQFPSIEKGWYSRIAYPAFVPNFTILYKRE